MSISGGGTVVLLCIVVESDACSTEFGSDNLYFENMHQEDVFLNGSGSLQIENNDSQSLLRK
nr:15482_t:CDS:2 [Entrophospora candida]